jgi:hypothetical protein
MARSLTPGPTFLWWNLKDFSLSIWPRGKENPSNEHTVFFSATYSQSRGFAGKELEFMLCLIFS